MTTVTLPAGPRLIPESALPRPRKVEPSPDLPNLVLVKRVGSWPVGAIVPKAAFPHGFRGHLELGVVVETNRPATHGTALAFGNKCEIPSTKSEKGEAIEAEVRHLRGVVADLEGKLATAREGLAARDAEIQRLRDELANAEELFRSQQAAAEVVHAATVQARLDAGPVPVPAPGRSNLPVATPPWTGDILPSAEFGVRSSE